MAWAFLVGALTLPVAEIMVWIHVADSIGGLATVALTVLAILAGSVLLRHGGLGMALEVRARMERGEPPGPAVFDGLCIALAGFLLLLPGFISDGLALLLMFRPVRVLLLRAVASRVVVANQGPAPQSGPTVIDGEYEIIPPESGPPPSPDHKRLEP
ncbi:putative FxsA cytoplasmic membrane protein [Magnetospirillum sp. XM-1]|uniref:FxsA family protein n=1 Tax=Magnetospirillum sp. XM-1 TaxID=1663591 RepID=UPI00073DF4B9|nr:FxsA family protein [Magnetospirillum sp. XM-1]CUW37896.1 putative FxsA cytoplasmic membrane protein [Magnetospirillum sp. XM-1]